MAEDGHGVTNVIHMLVRQEGLSDKKLIYRIRYKKTLPEPNRLVIWDIEKDIEYTTDNFELDNCSIKMYYGNSKAQEIQCGAKAILEVYKNE